MTIEGYEVRFPCHPDSVESLENWLFDSGAASVSLIDAADQPLLEPGVGETPLWDNITVCAYFPGESRTTVEALSRQHSPAGSVHAVHARQWERAWMDTFKPMDFGNGFWVVPTESEAPPDARVILRLDPGLAFGTGTHPTTSMCLKSLAKNSLSGIQVLDFGCGSGILAIAASLLGADRITAIDNDPQALLATTENARINGVSANIRVTDELDSTVKYDLIVANILANILIDHATRLKSILAGGGRVILSGILESQKQAVVDAFAPLQLIAEDAVEEWIAITLGDASC